MKDFITDPATKFDFMPADFVPFKDKKVCEYVRSLRQRRSLPRHSARLWTQSLQIQ